MSWEGMGPSLGAQPTADDSGLLEDDGSGKTAGRCAGSALDGGRAVVEELSGALPEDREPAVGEGSDTIPCIPSPYELEGSASEDPSSASISLIASASSVPQKRVAGEKSFAWCLIRFVQGRKKGLRCCRSR